MKLLIEKIQDRLALYIREMRFLLSAEEMISIKTAFLVDNTTDEELKQLFRKHWQDSEERATRLRTVLNRFGDEYGPIKCKAVYTLFDEAEDLVQDATHESIVNIALLAVARRIKHYELAFYETVQQFAAVLGYEADARLLEDAVRSEREATLALAKIADRLNAAPAVQS